MNTGGGGLTEQEVRNSIAVSINAAFYNWLIERSVEPAFVATTDQTETALEAQAGVESPCGSLHSGQSRIIPDWTFTNIWTAR